MGKLVFQTQVAPATPATGYAAVYVQTSDKKLHWIDDAGVNSTVGGGSVTSIAYVAPATGLTITGTTPVTSTGTWTFALANDLSALEGLAGTGYAKRTGTDAWALSQISLTADVTGTLPLANGGTGGATAAAARSSLGLNSLTTSPAFSATPTLDTTDSEVIYFGDLTANVTAFNLSGTRPKVIVAFRQDATGGRTVTAGTSIDFGVDIPNLTGISTAANAYTYVAFLYHPTTTKYRPVMITK